MLAQFTNTFTTPTKWITTKSTYIFMLIHICIYIYILMYIHTYRSNSDHHYLYTYAYTYMHIYIYICIYTYICTYTQIGPTQSTMLAQFTNTFTTPTKWITTKSTSATVVFTSTNKMPLEPSRNVCILMYI
jgi:hypothetical protein